VCVYADSGDWCGMESTLSGWRDRSSSLELDYELAQPVLMQQCTLTQLCADLMPTDATATTAAVQLLLCSAYQDWATAARKAGRFQVRHCLAPRANQSRIAQVLLCTYTESNDGFKARIFKARPKLKPRPMVFEVKTLKPDLSKTRSRFLFLSCL